MGDQELEDELFGEVGVSIVGPIETKSDSNIVFASDKVVDIPERESSEELIIFSDDEPEKPVFKAKSKDVFVLNNVELHWQFNRYAYMFPKEMIGKTYKSLFSLYLGFIATFDFSSYLINNAPKEVAKAISKFKVHRVRAAFVEFMKSELNKHKLLNTSIRNYFRIIVTKYLAVYYLGVIDVGRDVVNFSMKARSIRQSQFLHKFMNSI